MEFQSLILLGVLEHLFDGGHTAVDIAQAVLAQRHHAEFDGFLAQDDGRGSLGNQFANPKDRNAPVLP